MNEVKREKRFNNEKILQIVHGDITEEKVDAIVNAANKHLAHGGGVAGAIVRAGGYIIQEESYKKAPVPTGSAVYTGAGNLPCKFVIHAVGPVYGEGDENQKLRSAIKSAIHIGNHLKIKSISFPAISSGIFGFPKPLCAEIFLEEAELALNIENGSVSVIRLCNFDSITVNIFLEKFDERFNI